ncbi:hypothetical protein DACRYDRAFT_96499 [Dacryopinax primogenitus]|uniref:C3H1-type domain-containing protein n=1 Tax=Dacryopinax primogenitus (strain DJM 731) TaxID=1858805 RepID=M5G4X4_DACPD|nr:uncharacterized protein DACRYDRAFT_96499 [Dacryopinax primogenitus]EJT98802.1 hypothetical protein DACRYDRAFT_96499 [Dacryopinax primogenitus]
MARLEEKARKEALAKSAASSGRSTPMVPESVGSDIASPALLTPSASHEDHPRRVLSSADGVERYPSAVIDEDVQMKDDSLTDALNHQSGDRGNVQHDEINRLTVVIEANQGPESESGEKGVMEFLDTSTVDQTTEHGEQQKPEHTYRFFKPFVSIFDEYPLLRSHDPPALPPTDIQANHDISSSRVMQFGLLKKEAISKASNLNPSARLCQFETNGGRCRDDACPDVHAKDWRVSESALAGHLASLYPSVPLHRFEQTVGKLRLDDPFAPISTVAKLTLTAHHLT